MMLPRRLSPRSTPMQHRKCHLIAFVAPAEHDLVASLEGQLNSFGVLPLSRELSQRGDGWPVQGCTIHCEMRTMARTIPADFQRVPVDVAPEVSASGGMQMKGTAFIPIRRDLFQAVSYDCATSRF